MSEDIPSLHWDSPELGMERAVRLGEGDSCECFLVDGRLVVRLARHDQASRALQRELCLLPALAPRVHVAIPEIQSSGLGPGSAQRFLTYPLIRGEMLTAEILESLDARCRRRLIEELATFTRELHAFPVAIAAACGVEELVLRDYLPHLVTTAKANIGDRITPAVWRHHEALLDLYLREPRLNEYTPAWLHGDLSPDHVLADPSRCLLTGVIDFGDCCITDPCWELIRIQEGYGDETFDDFLSVYCPGEPGDVRQRVRIYRHLNNLQWCLTMKSEGGQAAFEEALAVIAAQAAT